MIDLLPFRRCLVFTAALFAFLPLPASAKTRPDKTTVAQVQSEALTAPAAGQYAVYAMMASNAYHNRKYIDYPLDQLGWRQVDAEGKPTRMPSVDHPLTGLAYDIWENQRNNEVVIAYRGTDGPWDFVMGNFAVPVSPAYNQAKREFADYAARHPDKKITVTGHSLGGAIALALSAGHEGVDAVVFNTSPRVFDAIAENEPAAKRVLIHQKGDFLEFFREHSNKFLNTVRQFPAFVCEFKYVNGHNHNINNLAREMLGFGAKANPVLMPVREAVLPEEGLVR